MDKKEFPCPKCEKKCKSAAGLIGHIRLEHGELKKKTYPDEIADRLEAIEAVVATTINPGEAIKTEEEIRKALELLLPAAEKYRLQLGPIGKPNFWGYHKKWLVKKVDYDWR